MLYHSGALARLGLQDRLPGHVLVQCTLSLSLSHTHTHTHTRICRLKCRCSTHKPCFNSIFILRLDLLPLPSILQNRDHYLVYIILCTCCNNTGTDKSVTYLNGQQEGRHPRGRKELLHRDRRLGGHKHPQVSGGHTCTSRKNTHLCATMSAFILDGEGFIGSTSSL